MSERGSPPLEERPQGDALQEGQRPFADAASNDGLRAPARRRGRVMAWAFSIAAHLTVFTALFWPYAGPPPHADTPPILVNLVDEPKPEPPGPPDKPPGPPAAAPVKAEVPQKPVRATARRRSAPAPAPAEDSKPLTDTFADVLSETELAGATSADAEGAGGGGGGGSCDIARIVQQALRRDPLVRSAVGNADRLGKSVMLWNGDWVRSGGQDGKGLSAVREAVLWEVAFAPAACRNKRVHGLVLLSLADGNTRFAIGSGDWRWSDLLEVRPSER
ncbi:MAG TPA: hypothetical protein VNW15_15410 [Rhizomicrobium sp.]|jgi:hypothetical protein|nr:hypothetical protein [Rhizomicrobium sp.]